MRQKNTVSLILSFITLLARQKGKRAPWYLSKKALAIYSLIIVYWFGKDGLRDVIIPKDTTQSCAVISVYDGDTITAQCDNNAEVRIRLLHIDTPEIAQKPWGAMARDKLKILVGNHVDVYFQGQDRYNRHLGVLSHPEQTTSINEQMVAAGMARVYTQYKPPAAYIEAMKKAKKAKLGIWKQKGLQQDPALYRKMNHEEKQ